jgi:hypothetical protein
MVDACETVLGARTGQRGFSSEAGAASDSERHAQ